MFDGRRFLNDKFKNPGGVVAMLSAYGLDTPSIASVEKWFQRGAVPGEWLPVLLTALEIDNLSAVSILPYVEREGAA